MRAMNRREFESTIHTELERGGSYGEYLELDMVDLPEIAAPKVEPKKLSTGQAPLEIAEHGSGWHLRCTGCGEASNPVRFRWQVLDQTVDCRCA